MTRVRPGGRLTPSPTYRERIVATRQVTLAVAALDLLFAVGGYIDLHQPSQASAADVTVLLTFEAGFVLLLLTYAILLGARPRPWLSVAVAAAVLADQTVWFGPQAHSGVGLGQAAPCFGLPLALWLTVSALRTALAERAELRRRPEAASHAGLAVGAAVAVWLVAAWAHVERPRRHLALRPSARLDLEQCRGDLRAWYLAEKAYRRASGRYDARLDEIHLDVARGNHYAYFAAPEGPLEERKGVIADRPAGATGIQAELNGHAASAAVDRAELPPRLAGGAALGLEGACPDCEATAVCAGRPMGDDLDVWSISTRDRLLADGHVLRAGVPFHERDGVGSE